MSGGLSAQTGIVQEPSIRMPREPVLLLGLALLALSVLAWRWVGYQGHDDASYAAAAMDWVRDGNPLGVTHWALRYTLVLPIAATIALFGPSIWALTVVNLACFAAFLVIGYLATRHWFGVGSAVCVTLINILLPQFPVQATYANPDLPEMTLVMAAFWMLMLARQRGGPAGLLFAVGLVAGIGFLTRETAIALVPLFGLIFLFRPGFPRLRYALIGLGFALVVGAQFGYFAARTGDPLYRVKISASHDNVDRAGKAEAAAAQGNAVDGEGVLATSPALAPFVVLFVSQKYGLLFYLGIPAFLLLRLSGRLSPDQRDVLDLLLLGAVVSFLFVALNTSKLYIVPRYFMAMAAFLVPPIGILAARWMAAGGWRRLLAMLGLAGFVASSLLLLYLENTNPMRAEKSLIGWQLQHGGTLHVDPITLRRLDYLLLASGAGRQITSEPPGSGALVGVKEGVAEECLRTAGCTLQAEMQRFQPQPGWAKVETLAPPLRWIGTLIDALPGSEKLPRDLRRKIGQPGFTVTIWRTP
jgi:4-amino-4-deoxy-L-arabinose transferase-like glycosyltransferase